MQYGLVKWYKFVYKDRLTGILPTVPNADDDDDDGCQNQAIVIATVVQHQQLFSCKPHS